MAYECIKNINQTVNAYNYNYKVYIIYEIIVNHFIQELVTIGSDMLLIISQYTTAWSEWLS